MLRVVVGLSQNWQESAGIFTTRSWCSRVSGCNLPSWVSVDPRPSEASRSVCPLNWMTAS